MKIKLGQKIFLYTLLTLVSVIFVFPVFYMYSKSMMTGREVYALPPKIFPEHFSFKNYRAVFERVGTYNGVSYLLVYLFNTVKVIVGVTTGVVLSASLCAYGFTKIKFPGRDFMFSVLLSTMMLPGVVTMIPLYILFNNFGWLNTHLPLWVPMWFGGGAVNIFLIMQYMRTLPKELNEVATLDGASNLRQYVSIIMPNCVPILTVIAIGGIIGSWNDLMSPLIYLDTKEKWTLALGITNLGIGTDGSEEGVQFVLAACGMMVLLPLFTFIFGQKFFIESVILSGIKG